MSIKSFLKDLRFDRETVSCAVTVLFFFVFSSLFRFDGTAVYVTVVRIILGFCFCTLYFLSTRYVMTGLNNRIRTVFFVLLYCDIPMYGYVFADGDIMRSISTLLFIISLICIFANKFIFISVITIFVSAIHTPSLSLILLLLMICNCKKRQKITYIYPIISVIAVALRLIIYHSRNFTFQNLKFLLLSNDYMFFDTKDLLYLLSYLPIITFFGVLWIKAAYSQKSTSVKFLYFLPLVFSVISVVLLPFVKNLPGPVFINTVFLLFFTVRKDNHVTKTFETMTEYLSQNPVTAIIIVLSTVAAHQSANDALNSILDKIDIIS